MKKGPLRGTQLLLAASFLCTSHHLDLTFFWGRPQSILRTHSLSTADLRVQFLSSYALLPLSFSNRNLTLVLAFLSSPRAIFHRMTLPNGRAAAPTFFADDPFPLKTSTPFPFYLSIATSDVGNALVNAVARPDHPEGQQ
jgi:hypothetical protein